MLMQTETYAHLEHSLLLLVFLQRIWMVRNPGVIMGMRIALSQCLSLFLLLKFSINILYY